MLSWLLALCRRTANFREPHRSILLLVLSLAIALFFIATAVDIVANVFWVRDFLRNHPQIYELLQSHIDAILAAAAVVAFVLLLWGGPHTDVQLTAEHAPGAALVRVDNRGARDAFTATAKVAGVSERPSNTKWLQTYALRWRSNGRNEVTIGQGAADSLLIASSGKTIQNPPSGRDIHELLLEGYVDGQPAKVDWFRWHDGDSPGAVAIELEIAVSSPAAVIAKQRFVVTSREWGGVLIKAVEPSQSAAPPEQAPVATRLQDEIEVPHGVLYNGIDFQEGTKFHQFTITVPLPHPRLRFHCRGALNGEIGVEILVGAGREGYRSVKADIFARLEQVFSINFPDEINQSVARAPVFLRVVSETTPPLSIRRVEQL